MRKGDWRMLKVLLAIVIALTITLVMAVPAFAATSADVTVTATGAFVSFTSNTTDIDFGLVATSSTTNTSGIFIEFTNASSVTTNISVRMLATTWTASAAGWTHSDTAAGVNTAAMQANSNNTTTWGSSVFVKYAAPFNEIRQSAQVGAKVCTGLSLLAPTSFTNGNTNNNTVRFSFYSSS